MLKPVATDTEALKILDERLRWLSAWTIHHANHVRENDDGLKVGGHQASCASITAIMAALYFHALGSNDRVAVKPHAGPVLHAIHYLLGSQSREALENFRGFGGAQSYPSRTKDRIPVDFSTGSVGLGVAITLFASLVQDYLSAHGWLDDADGGPNAALVLRLDVFDEDTQHLGINPNLRGACAPLPADSHHHNRPGEAQLGPLHGLSISKVFDKAETAREPIDRGRNILIENVRERNVGRYRCVSNHEPAPRACALSWVLFCSRQEGARGGSCHDQPSPRRTKV